MHFKTAEKILKKVQKDYDQISEEFHQTRQKQWKEFEKFLPYMENGETVADLGCGNGRFYKFLNQHRKVNYIGIDNSKNLLEEAKKQFSKVKFLEGNLLKIPLKDSSIKIAVAIASFHHIPSKKLRAKSLKEIYRILKLKGKFIITVWNLFQPKYIKYIWQARLKHIYTLGKYDSRDTFIPWGKSEVKRYYYAFKRKELKNLLEKNGFIILEEHFDNNIVFICQKK